MKKNILNLLPVLLFFCLLTGCSEQENEGLGYVGNEIRIATNIEAVTRGVINSPLTADLEVGLIRLDKNENSYVGEETLNGVVFSADKKLRIIDETTDAYYPADMSAKVRLIGWYPNEAGAFNAENGTVTFPIDGSTDIMYTEMIEGTSKDGFTGGVTFDHALSQVVVTAYAEDSPAKAKWGGITSVTVLNKEQNCILTLPGVSADYDGVGDDPAISFSAEMGGISVEGEDIDIDVDIKNAVMFGYAMFAPTQSSTSEELIIEVTTKEGGPLQAKVSHKFEAGKKYEITLRFSMVGVSVGVQPWAWGTGTYPATSDTDTEFHIENCKDKIISVILANPETLVDEKVVMLQLDEKGDGKIAIGDLLVKSIQVAVPDSKLIWIGRKKFKPDDKVVINLTVKSSDYSSVDWRMDGDGTTALINTAAEMRLGFNKSGATVYKFESDIDLMNQEWTPVNVGSTAFTNVIDGDKHKIYGFLVTTFTSNTANNAYFGGLVRSLGANGVIKNLHIASGKINISNIVFTQTTSATGFYVGAFVGNLGGSSAGGEGEIIGCSNAADINVDNRSITTLPIYLAGIVGYLTRGGIVGCLNTGKISNNIDTYASGICGRKVLGDIIACVNKGSIQVSASSGNTYSAGIVGRSTVDGTISACYNTGQVSSGLGAINKSGGTVANCFSVSSNTLTGNWPTVDSPSTNWGKAGTGLNGNYWIDLGSWNDGVDPTYPKLYWETPVVF